MIDVDARDLNELKAWIPARHKQALDPGDMPDSLRRAILSFLITCAVRKLRGQATEHNSMLVHVTRFTRVQAIVHNQIEDALIKIKRRLRFGDDGVPDSVKVQLGQLWETDFVPTNLALASSDEMDIGNLPEWRQVMEILPEIVSGIRVKQINGLAQDVLDYDSHREEGIDVIAVGGDKLSRGLTLPGLSISYFNRQTDMYDTLLQMGRWFGYRTGYLDLCRLYTSWTLQVAFEHIAFASDELRRDFDYMERIGSRPVDYGLKVKAHPVLSPTSSNKRRHARDVVLYSSYAGGISEVKSFSLIPSVLENNREILDILVETLRIRNGTPGTSTYGRSYPGSLLWRNVTWSEVRPFLDGYKAQVTSTRARPDLWVRYVDRQIEASGDLSLWNLALVGGDLEPPVSVGGINLRRRLRQEDQDLVPDPDSYRIKRLVTTRDAAIDLNNEEWDEALRLDPTHRVSGRERSEPTAHAICRVREIRRLNPLLLIYLPSSRDSSHNPPVVGLAAAFPGSDRAVRDEERYTVNTVYQAGHREDEEELDVDDTEK